MFCKHQLPFNKISPQKHISNDDLQGLGHSASVEWGSLRGEQMTLGQGLVSKY